MILKKISTVLISAVFCVSLAGCSKGVNNKDTKENSNQIVYASTKDIRDINPHLYSGEMAAQNMVFEPLVIMTDKGVKPWLAKSYDISEDGLEYTFHLRDDVNFTDGEKFNAKAVKQNFDAIIDNIDRHAWLDLVNEIDSTEVVDDYTFKLNLKHPYYPTLEELSLTRPFRFISPKCFKNGGTKDGVSGYIGTGPWVLKEHKDDQYATFKVNENYWGEKPKVDSVKWSVMPDHQSMVLGLEKGDIDLIFGSDGDMMDSDSFEKLQKEGKYETKMSQPISSRAILLNSNREITKDLKVRQALQFAVDKESIAQGVLNGTESVADTLLAKTVPYCNVDLKKSSLDIEKANKLLDEAGWKMGNGKIRVKNGKKLELILSYNTDNAQEKTIGEYLQSDFSKIGVSLKLLGEEKQAFSDRQKTGDFDLQYSLSWGIPYDPQSYLSSWRIPAHGDYQAQLGLNKKKWLDETITNIMIEADKEKRQSMYSEVLTYINDEQVYIPLTYARVKAVYTANLKGVTFNPSQYEIPFEKMYFK